MAVYRFAYVAVLIAAIAFSQAYAGHLSSVVLITVVALPVASFIFTFIAKFAFTVSFDTDAEVLEKNKAVKLRIFIKNRFLFPCSSTYISASMPGFSEKKDARLIFSLAPFQSKSLNLTYTTEYRGKYEINFKVAYFYDYFKIFKFKKKLNLSKEIVVTPRIIDTAAQGGFFAVSDEDNENQALNSVKGERSFTRKYAEGDDVRNIHWKLSSKQEDYMVWQNAENLSAHSVIICDMTSYGNSEKEKAILTDAILESALAVALYNLKNDCKSMISFYDPEERKTENIPIEHLSHLYKAAFMAATVESYEGEPTFRDECRKHLSDKGSVVLITHRGDKELARTAEELAAFSNVYILLTGEAEDNVGRYVQTIRNVKMSQIDPWNIVPGITEAIRRM